jgi:hypothetical protein
LITYVDAAIPIIGDNSSPATNARDGTDDLWCLRAYANGATIYEGGGGTGGSNDTNIENCLRLLTSVSVPANPNGLGYDVFAYFWTDGSNWRIRASTTNDAGELELFCLNPVPSGDPLPTQAVAADFDSAVMVAEGNRTLLQAYLGTEGVGVTTGNVTIKAYIDDDPAHTYQNWRTWYDGIGYRAVPEPATIALLGLGGLALLRRKRA